MTPFHIDAWVVLPDHMHCIWTLPQGDANYPGRWRAIKIAFSKSIPGGANARGERDIWQKRYWEHTIRGEQDFRAHLDYVHFNPVKHGFVSHPAQWKFSSFRTCVERGFYAAEWATPTAAPPETGEA